MSNAKYPIILAHGLPFDFLLTSVKHFDALVLTCPGNDALHYFKGIASHRTMIDVYIRQ